ncbi:MAG: NADP-dependent phosphogluconate dehydrogenase [Gemmataceae bacterium]|nr:NADP-dependent phosphogluconate dehydrogenase [Gemmataceae bacterium]
MATNLYKLGMVGLGVMGRSLVLNMADHGFPIAGYDKDAAKGSDLLKEGAGKPVGFAATPAEFVAMLEKPRAIMLLVAPAKVVGFVLDDLLPLLDKDDLVIDAGNSYFKDTDARFERCAEKGVHFFGMGVSGGESGARHGPSMMPGGDRPSYERVRPILESVAAKVGGEPCVAWVGNKSAGHYVKMVHNGIEYGIMQMIAETYDILHRGLGLSNDELAATFDAWNKSELNSFLVEITARIFKMDDDKEPGRLVDRIKDAARQKGTGKWTSQDALDLTVPVPTIDMAVMGRNISGMTAERSAVAKALGEDVAVFAGDRKGFIEQAKSGLFLATVASYAQGLDLLKHASEAYGYGIQLAEVAKIWRGGCIIRSTFLEDIRAAYTGNPALPNLLADPKVAAKAKAALPGLKWTLRNAIDMGVPCPSLMASLAYIDSLRCGPLPTNLIQAQRDFFGAHTYERTDAAGTFHTKWEE